MKYLFPLCALFMLLLAACQPAPPQAEKAEKPLILCSIYPYELLVRQLVGDAIETRSLIPPTASVHSFSPQPSDLKHLHKADLVITNGMGLESMLAQNLKTLGDKHLVVADLLKDAIALDSLSQVRDQLMHQNDETGHSSEYVKADPHLWTSLQMLLKLNTKLKNELTQRFTDFAPLITHNYQIIQQELTQADEQIRQERAAFTNPALVTYHNSFHYFTQDYEINYLGWVQSSPGQEPSARDIAQLGAKIQEHQVKAIFIEPQQNPKSAEVLAREYQLEVYTLDPLGSTLGVNTIAEMILANWNSMKQAF